MGCPNSSTCSSSFNYISMYRYKAINRKIPDRTADSGVPCPPLLRNSRPRGRKEGNFMTHLSRSGPRFDLSYYHKIEQNMKIGCLGFHKMYKRKKSTEGPKLLILGFQVFFHQNMVKITLLITFTQIHLIGAETDHHLKFW